MGFFDEAAALEETARAQLGTFRAPGMTPVSKREYDRTRRNGGGYVDLITKVNTYPPHNCMDVIDRLRKKLEAKGQQA